MSNIKISLNPAQRQIYLDNLLELDGLSHINEDENAAYCPISLTSTPDKLKPILQNRQQILMEKVLKPAGINAYDPASAPYSPDTNLTSNPDEVYLVDSSKIVGARFFVGHIIFPSTGFGIEAEKAKVYNRISVFLIDKNIRISRMQPHRAIYLQYSDFSKEYKKFIPVFRLLRNYNPGMGFIDRKPVIIGFEKNTNKTVDLENLIYTKFKNLKYIYNGTINTLKLEIRNKEILL